eukprot:m.1446059 g.1446059  ORF g.1446059 m.1446059 type:complete len:358 (+) comp25107_c0_seq57:1126-2199(+)
MKRSFCVTLVGSRALRVRGRCQCDSVVLCDGIGQLGAVAEDVEVVAIDAAHESLGLWRVEFAHTIVGVAVVVFSLFVRLGGGEEGAAPAGAGERSEVKALHELRAPHVDVLVPRDDVEPHAVGNATKRCHRSEVLVQLVCGSVANLLHKLGEVGRQLHVETLHLCFVKPSGEQPRERVAHHNERERRGGVGKRVGVAGREVGEVDEAAVLWPVRLVVPPVGVAFDAPQQPPPPRHPALGDATVDEVLGRRDDGRERELVLQAVHGPRDIERLTFAGAQRRGEIGGQHRVGRGRISGGVLRATGRVACAGHVCFPKANGAATRKLHLRHECRLHSLGMCEGHTHTHKRRCAWVAQTEH